MASNTNPHPSACDSKMLIESEQEYIDIMQVEEKLHTSFLYYDGSAEKKHVLVAKFD